MPTGIRTTLNGITINGVTYTGVVDLENVFHARAAQAPAPNVSLRSPDGRDLSDWFVPLTAGGTPLQVDTGFKIASGADLRTVYAKAGTVVGSGPGGGCLPFDTHVPLWNFGTKQLGDLRPGDIVMGYYRDGMLDAAFENWRDWMMPPSAASGGIIVPVAVTCSMIGEFASHYVLNDSLCATYEHPFLILRDGLWQWIQMRDIVIGDALFNDAFSPIPVQSIKVVEEPMLFANIDVEEVDNFYIIGLGSMVLTHNDNKT